MAVKPPALDVGAQRGDQVGKVISEELVVAVGMTVDLGGQDGGPAGEAGGAAALGLVGQVDAGTGDRRRRSRGGLVQGQRDENLVGAPDPPPLLRRRGFPQLNGGRPVQSGP